MQAPDMRYKLISVMHATESVAHNNMTGVTHMCVSVILLVNKCHLW